MVTEVAEVVTDNTIEALRRLGWRRDEAEAELLKVIKDQDLIAEYMRSYWANLNAGSAR